VLDMASDDLWIEQLARDIAATRSDSGDISFRLMPRHLGRLDVAMQMDGEGVSVRLDTQHEATATIVTAAQGKLVEDLRQQGVRVTGAEVTCTPGETGRQSQQGQGRGAAADASHLIETTTDGADPRADRPHDERTADRRGRFA
jgi:flagellar hook-length control protein FliK